MAAVVEDLALTLTTGTAIGTTPSPSPLSPTLTVAYYAPLTGSASARNYLISRGTSITFAYIFLATVDTTDTPVGFRVGDVTYIWGTTTTFSIPVDPGAMFSMTATTYALPVTGTFHVLASVGPSRTIRNYSIDWKTGSRIIGLHLDDYRAHLGEAYHSLAVRDILKVVPSVEITGITVTRA